TRRSSDLTPCENVHAGGCCPVHGSHVAVVRDVWMPEGEHLGRRGVELAEPCRSAAEHLIDGHTQTTDTREQFTGSHVSSLTRTMTPGHSHSLSAPSITAKSSTVIVTSWSRAWPFP